MCEMADDCRTLQAGACQKMSHVVLAEHLQDLAVNGSGHAVVAGSCISPEAVKRSRLLSGLGDTQGLAPLPGGITFEDIKLWEAACLSDLELSADELATVLQVRGHVSTVLLHMHGPRLTAAKLFLSLIIHRLHTIR